MLRGAAGRHYTGLTSDLARRMEEHRRGHTHTTRRMGGNLEVVAAAEVTTLKAARGLERELKRKKNPRLALALLQHQSAETIR